MTVVILAWIIKASLLLALALVGAALSARRSAAFRHAVVTAGVVAALSLPLVSVLSPAWQLPNAGIVARHATLATEPPPSTRSPIALGASTNGAAPDASAFATFVIQVCAWLWLGGAALSLALLGRGLVRLSALAKRSIEALDPEWVTLLEQLRASVPGAPVVRLLMSDDYPVPITWGVLAPRILLPTAASEWSSERRRAVLLHELAHIARRDWVLHLAAEALRALLWFNPLAVLACRWLRRDSEIACDDRVVAGGVAATDYAAHLLALARGVHGSRHVLPASPIAEATTLERRIRAMLKQGLNRAPVGRPAGLAVFAVASVLTISVAGGSAAQNFATFAGSVVDPTNAVLPQVTFQLTNSATAAKYEIRSDRNGRVELPGLPPGDYAIEAWLPGFATFRSRIRLVDGQRFEPALTMQVGELEETVTATDPGPGVDDRPRIATAPARPNPSCTAAAATAPAIGGNIRAPRKIRNVSPVYPANLRGSGRSGIVELKGRIGPDGRIEAVTTITSSDPDFEAAAIEAVSDWAFDSTLLNCVPWPVDMRAHVQFAGRQ